MKDPNENRLGYKKTKVGWIPVEWECVYLPDIATIKRGRFSYRPRNEPRFYGGSYPFVQTGDVSAANIFIRAYTQTLNEEGLAISRLFPAGTILMTIAANIGDCAILTFSSACPDSVVGIQVKRNHASVYFLTVYLNSIKDYYRYLAPRSAQQNINVEALSQYQLPLPPFPEQKAIADLLSTWDEAIEKTERLILAKENQLEAYARYIFNPKDNEKRKGWKIVKLKTVLTEHGDKSTGCEEVYSVSVHKGLVNQVEHLGRSFSAANTTNYNCVHYGDIVYTKSPTGDFPLGIVKQSYAEKDVIVSPLYGVFTPKTFNLGIILDFYFSSPTRTRNYLSPIVQKGAKNTIAITNETFLSKALHLSIDTKLQKSIAEFVYTARNEIDLLKQLADKYRTQKRGLMQKLLTGEWRIKPEIIQTFLD